MTSPEHFYEYVHNHTYEQAGTHQSRITKCLRVVLFKLWTAALPSAPMQSPKKI